MSAPSSSTASNAATAPPSTPRLTASGLFAEDLQDDAYVLANWPRIRGRVRDIGVYGGSAFLLMGLVDYAILGRVPMLALILLGRLGVAGYGWQVTRQGRRPTITLELLPRLRRQLFLFELLTVPTFLLEAGVLPTSAAFSIMSALTLVFALYAFAPLLCRYSLWLGPVLTLPFMGMVVAGFPLDWRLPASAALLLGFANIAGWQLAVAQARHLRLAWLDREALRLEVAERKLVEQALERSQTHLRRLFEAAPVAMVLLRLEDGAILRYNQAARTLLDPKGLSRQPLVSLDFYADPQRRELLRAHLRAGQALSQIELQLRNAEGLLRDTLVSAQPIEHEGQACVLIGLTDVSGLKQLQRQLQQQAEQDMLTGLPNRRGFVAGANDLLDRSDSALALLMIDLDHFKRINDSHGHRVGDEVLEQFGALLNAHMRQGDRVARFGGEEFVVLLAVASGRAAVDAAERMRSYVEQHPFATSAGVLRLSVSIGLALREPGKPVQNDLASLLQAADDALYRAKQGGRNRVEMQALGA
ncbi:Diguanylate cyclase [Thiomonas sp. X19]|uniref:GGDEF domain-containing protein n=1 Tax=Thiomonas sp. X19 TaxID=1050370 RepID=UPI000B741386|nr:sensor domain-containing diguanylate cyclase [Thiomonas sp. X19]SCC91324.1 Diguanylate cyclase [Thiomonas sp. X19]